MCREMKKTGIQWLPEIAESFSVGYVKQFFEISKDLSNEGEPDRVLKLARAGIVEKDVTLNEGQMAASYAGYNKVKVGDLLLNPMDLYSGANCNVSELNGVISPAYSNLRAKDEGIVEPKFYDYYFKTQYWQMAMFAHGKGVSFDNRWTLNNDTLLKYEIPVVPYEQQKKIVTQIQSEEKKVDALISNVQSQIEKLKAYKQSLITEVVTKGLTPDVEMKDSGVDWIGEIPTNWNVKKIKHIADPNVDNSFIDGDWIESGDISSEGIRYYTTGNVGDGVFKKQGDGYITEDTFNRLNCKLAYPGDLIVSRLNEPYGRACIIPEIDEKCVLAVDIVIFRPQKTFDKEYLCYMMQTPNYHAAVGDKARGTAMRRISRNNLGNIYLIAPPIDAQKDIARFLNEKCAQLDQLIFIKENKLLKLNEYKKSLIYEYVTGKKEVM